MQFEITRTINLYGRTFKRGQTALLREYIEREGFQASADGPTHTGAAALEAFCGKYARRGQIRLIGLEGFDGTLTEADAAFYETYPGQTPGNDELPAPEAVEVVPFVEVPGEDEYDMTDSARELAAELGLDPASITGTGKGGRITKADVEAHDAIIEAAKSAADCLWGESEG